MKIKAKSIVHDHIVDDSGHKNLSPGKTYEVIGLSDSHFRIVNDCGEPILYPKALFDIKDPTIPETWVREDFEDNEYHIDPPELMAPGFYEDYFDGFTEAVDTFETFRRMHGLPPLRKRPEKDY